MRANSLQFTKKIKVSIFLKPGDCEEGCQISRVRGDDDESKQPPLYYHVDNMLMVILANTFSLSPLPHEATTELRFTKKRRQV